MLTFVTLLVLPQYILMEYARGGSVAGLLREKYPSGLPRELLLTYSRQLLSGVHFLHENIVIHRDLKGARSCQDRLPTPAATMHRDTSA